MPIDRLSTKFWKVLRSCLYCNRTVSKNIVFKGFESVNENSDTCQLQKSIRSWELMSSCASQCIRRPTFLRVNT